MQPKFEDSSAPESNAKQDRRKAAMPIAVERRGRAARDNSSAVAQPKEAPSERRSRHIPAATDRRKASPEVAATTVAEPEDSTFMKAMDRYKRENRRPFPTWSEVLEVFRSLGYRKVAEETELPGATIDAAPAKG
jgi:hypothetical protein